MNLSNQEKELPQKAKSTNINTNTPQEKNIKEEALHYDLNNKKYDGYIYYNEKQEGKRPGILVVHEWWGLNDYSRNRAKQLAQSGYISMAVDMFGSGITAEDPASAQELANQYYKNPDLTKIRLDKAIALLKTYPQTDSSKIGAIGYCFGGFVVLNAAKLGAGLKAVVSFHGELGGAKPDKNLIKAKILICHGAADPYVNPQVDQFKNEMDSAGIDYDFISYPNATHAFSNPNATAKGEKYDMPLKYNEAADTGSWNAMKEFFKKNL